MTERLRRNARPILLMLVLPPILAELGSGAMAPLHLFQPLRLFEFATLVYGFPVLVIREIAVRRRLGPLGIWCLGIVYGLYNEGVLAETLFHPGHSPWDFAAAYGLVAHLRVPFTFAITFWHGLFAVLLPIVFVEYLDRNRPREPWLPLKATWTLAVICLGVGVPGLLFGYGRGHPRSASVATYAGQLGFLVLAGAVAVLIAERAGRRPQITSFPQQPFLWRLFAFGGGLFWVVSTVPYMLAEAKVLPALYAAYFVVGAAVIWWVVSRHRETSLRSVVNVALGTEIMGSILAIPFGVVSGNLAWSLVGIVFAAIFVIATLRFRKRERVHA